jgi:hypothetical protein
MQVESGAAVMAALFYGRRFLRSEPRSRGVTLVASLKWRNVRYWHLADVNLSALMSAFAVAFGGKADMRYCTANVRF